MATDDTSPFLHEVIGSDQAPIDLVSKLFDKEKDDERRATLSKILSEIQNRYESTEGELSRKRKDIQEARYKYENLADFVQSVDQLRGSIEEHRKMVRLNEGNLATTGSVLEYDTAKSKSNKLIQIIRAKMQYERAKEALNEIEKDDPSKTFSYLVDLQQSYETLEKHLSAGTANNELEDLKDGFLAWQSTALLLAIQDSDFDKIDEIQKVYFSLKRHNEFIDIFRRVSAKALRERDVQPAQSVPELIDMLCDSIQFILDNRLVVIKRYMKPDEAEKLIKEAVADGLEGIDFKAKLPELIGQEQDPIALTLAIKKAFEKFRNHLLRGNKHAEYVDLIPVLQAKTVSNMIDPFRSSFTNIALAIVNKLELKGSSHRVHMDNLNTSVTELLSTFQDMVAHSMSLFDENAKKIYTQPIERALDNLVSKLKAWQFWLDSQGRERKVEDLVTVCSSCGHLIYSLSELKKSLEASDDSFTLNIQGATRFTRQVCDRIIKRTCDGVVHKMTSAIQKIHADKTELSETARALPLFSISPHEYITNVGQELLHLFHQYEQFFLDDNVLHAFYYRYKKKYEGDEIYKRTMMDISREVINEFIDAIGDLDKLPLQHARQFLVDTVFLKDALDDLRSESTDRLIDIESKLRKVVEKK